MATIAAGPAADRPQILDPARGAGNREVRALFLYMLGSSYLASGDRTRALDVWRTLQVLDENLARLLINKIVPL